MTSPSEVAAVTSVASQFETVCQQRQADLLGMWLFLATEALLFGGAFVAYTVYRLQFTDGFREAGSQLHWLLGGVNTIVLLTSGLTMGAAEQSALAGRRRGALGGMLLTIALGTLFLLIKGYEYSLELEDQLLPVAGLPFHFGGAHPDQARLFYSFYVTLTGLHALHMTVGVIIIALICLLTYRWRNPGRICRQIQVVGLYWAFVDIVWVFVYTVLYLINQ
jgi:cytochrome c oxidase subunit 3